MLLFSEEEIGEIIDITEKMCDQGGWVKEVLPLAQKRMDIINNARTRLATSEQEIREKVLDVDTLGTLLNIIESCTGLTSLEGIAYKKAKRIEAELRSKHGGEP